MKYRMLTAEEMEIFDEDFKHFAVANGVSSEEWQEMNEKEIDKATRLVQIFSDTVLQKVYEKIKFIEHRSKSSCLVFKLNEEKIELISINAKDNTVNLSTPESIHDALVNSPGKLSIFSSSKSYNKERELEVHEMLTQGCVNSSESFWILLKKTLAE